MQESRRDNMRVKQEDLKNVKEYLKDKDKFYVLSQIIRGKFSKLYSDLETYIIGQSEEQLPTWIWSIDHLPKDKLIELKKDLENYITEKENKFTAKKEIYDFLEKEFNVSGYFEMGFLDCNEVIKPSKGKGIFVKPNYVDKVTLSEYWRDNMEELFHKKITQKEAIEEVEGWLEDKKTYVLKDSKGDIVSMAAYSVVDEYAKITHVFTPKEERGKGYCQYLVYSLSKMLLEEGYKLVLYTDYHYEASNAAYKKVGFKDEGILINFKINK